MLEVIRRDRLDFKVMLGAHLAAEMNNFGCPWGATYSEAQLEANVAENDAEVERLIDLARLHDDIVFSVAVGNEATVDWTDHFVPVERMIELVRRVKREVPQPVTFCENYVPWQDKLRAAGARAGFHLAAHVPGVGVQARARRAALLQGQLSQRRQPVPGQAGGHLGGGLGDELQRPRHLPGEHVARTCRRSTTRT